MGEARAEITIDRPADDVWAVVGNFGDLQLDAGHRVVRARRRRPRPRHVRHAHRGAPSTRATTRSRSLTYGIVDGDMKPEVHRATITVMPAGSGSFVTWDVETDDAMVEVMQGAYTGALAALKEQLEG